MLNPFKAICFTLFGVALWAASPSAAFSQFLPAKAAPAVAQKDSLNRETPSGTVFGFLQAAQSDNFAIAAQYLQMSPARRQVNGQQVAEQLELVMDRALAGSLRNVSTLPEGNSQEGVAPDRQNLGIMSSGDAEAELSLARVSDPTSGKIWLISSDTLSKLPDLYEQVQARQVEKKLPAWLVKHEFLGMALWLWFALLLLIPLAAGAAWLLLIALQVPLRWWAGRHGHADIQQMRSVSGPAWLLLGTLIHRILASYLGMPLLQRHYYTQVTAVAVTIGANWILWRVIRWFMTRVRTRALARGRGGTGSLMLLAERMVKAAIFIMTVFFVFGVLGFNLSTALAGVGIGGLAIGFGAQQTIANLFGGVSVLGDEVIRVGDVCRFGDRVGVVEDIGLRSTRVRTEERTLLAIPNGTVATINVENLSRREKILFKTTLALHTNTSQQCVAEVIGQIREVLKNNPRIEPARVRLTDLTPSAINVELMCYVLTRDYDEFAAVREEVLMKIMNLVEDSGATLAATAPTVVVNTDAVRPGTGERVNPKNADAMGVAQRSGPKNNS